MDKTEWLTIGRDDSKTIRVFTKLGQGRVHWVEDDGRFRRQVCVGQGCRLCAKGNRAQDRWTLGVIDRTDGQPKLLEVGAQVMSQLVEFATGANPMRLCSIRRMRKCPRLPERRDITIRNRGPRGGYELVFHKPKRLGQAAQDAVINFLSSLAEKWLQEKQ